MTPILGNEPDHNILQVGTNDAINSTPQKIFDDLLRLKLFIKEKLEKCEVPISLPVKRNGNGKASLTILLVNEKLPQLKNKLLATQVYQTVI